MKNSKNIAVSINNVSKIFSTGTVTFATTALKNISLEIAHGEFVVVGGANGSGKTVLMSLVAGLDAPTAGEIETDGIVGIVFQDADSQILGETVLEDAMFAPRNLPRNLCPSKNDARQIAIDALTKCGLSDKLDSPARFLSGGEKRRLAVAGVLAMRADIIIFDEPFANLDLDGVRQVTSILRELKNDCKTVIVLTHEIEKCLALADKFVVLYKSEICFDGTPEAGIAENLEQWGIHNPLSKYNDIKDLIWL